MKSFLLHAYCLVAFFSYLCKHDFYKIKDHEKVHPHLYFVCHQTAFVWLPIVSFYGYVAGHADTLRLQTLDCYR